jgi:hypothetical protein
MENLQQVESENELEPLPGETNEAAVKSLTELAERFAERINTATSEVTGSFEEQIVLGYRTQEYRNRKREIEEHIQIFNAMFETYLGIFKGKRPALATAKEIFLLPLSNADQLTADLKIQYLKHHNISIPNFPHFKLSVLVDAYEFPAVDLKAIESFVKFAGMLDHKSFNDSFLKFFNTSNAKMELSRKQDQALIEAHTVYASEEKIMEVLSAILLASGLDSLQTLGYSMHYLPEIDVRAMRLLKVSEDRRHIDINLNYFVGGPTDKIQKSLSEGIVVHTKRRDLSELPKAVSHRPINE